MYACADMRCLMYIYSLLPSTVSDLSGTAARKTQSPGYESAPARGLKSLEETEPVQVAVPTSAVLIYWKLI